MSEYLKLFLSSLFGLIGGLIIAALSNKYLIKSEKRKLKEIFLNEKYDIYKQIWRDVERIHIQLREKEGNELEVQASISNLNKKIIENSLHLDQNDAQLIDEYINAVKELKDDIYHSSTYGTVTIWETTSEISAMDQQLMLMVDRANIKKNVVIDKIRKVIGA